MKIIIEKSHSDVSDEPDLTRLEYSLGDYETADSLLTAFVRIMLCLGYCEKTVHDAVMETAYEYELLEKECQP